MKTMLRGIGVTMLCLVAGAVVLFLLQPRIPLGFATGPVSSLLSLLSGREQVIRGSYFIIPGEWTTLIVEDGSVVVHGGGDVTLKTEIASGRITAHLWSLFGKKLRLDALSVQGMTLDLSLPKEKTDPDKGTTKAGPHDFPPIPVFLEQINSLDLADITGEITSFPPGARISFQVIKAAGSIRPDFPGTFHLDAVVDNKPLTVDLEGGADGRRIDSGQGWPFMLHLHHKSVAVELSGTFLHGENGPELSTDFSLTGDHLNDVLSLMSRQGTTGQSFVLQGTVVLNRDDIRWNFSRVRMGDEQLSLSGAVQHYRSKERQFAVTMHDDVLDLDAVKGFFIPPNGKTKKSGADQQAKITKDDILIPDDLPVRNLVLDLDLKEIVMAGRTARNVQFNMAMHDGLIESAPFAMTVDSAELSGRFSGNLAESIPHFSLQYAISFVDIGDLLRTLRLSDESNIRIEEVTTALQTRGRTLGELFRNLDFTVSAGSGNAVFQDANSGAMLPVVLESTKVTGSPGKAVKATMQGRIGTTPVVIDLEFDDRRDEPPGSVNDVSVACHIDLAHTRLELGGNIPLPFKKQGTVLHGRITGTRLSDLTELLNVKLPDLGPYEVEGALAITREGYGIKGIDVHIGSSRLQGHLDLATNTLQPHLDIGLQAQHIQVDDFRSLAGMIRKGDKEAGLQAEKPPEDETEKDVVHLTDQPVIDSYDASIALDIEQVYSGEEYLGSGTMRIEQQNGAIQVAPLEMRFTGGTVAAEFSLSPSGEERVYAFKVWMKDFDYGVLARELEPDTDMSGIITLRASLESKSPDWDTVLANGNGYFDFSVQPRQLRAGVIDLWALNLFSYLVPVLTPKGESKVNCVGGRFTLKQGVMRQDELVIDTSKIQVNGVVEVDFKENLIAATLRPTPKRPQFYSLSTPIEIKGRLTDLSVRPAKGSLVGTVIRLATSYIVVPMQWIVQNRIPEDGTEACLQLVEGERE